MMYRSCGTASGTSGIMYRSCGTARIIYVITVNINGVFNKVWKSHAALVRPHFYIYSTPSPFVLNVFKQMKNFANFLPSL